MNGAVLGYNKQRILL